MGYKCTFATSAMKSVAKLSLLLQEFLSMPEYLISKISLIPTINSGPRQIMGLITLHNDTNCTEDNTYYLNILQLGHLYLTLEYFHQKHCNHFE